MPMYSAVCLKCGEPKTYYQTVANRADTPECCDEPTTKMLDTPMVSAMTWTGHQGFHAPDGVNGVGTWIESGSDYKKYMDKNGLVPANEGEQEVKIQQANQAAASETKLNDAVLTAYRKHSKF